MFRLLYIFFVNNFQIVYFILKHFQGNGNSSCHTVDSIGCIYKELPLSLLISSSKLLSDGTSMEKHWCVSASVCDTDNGPFHVINNFLTADATIQFSYKTRFAHEKRIPSKF